MLSYREVDGTTVRKEIDVLNGRVIGIGGLQTACFAYVKVLPGGKRAICSPSDGSVGLYSLKASEVCNNFFLCRVRCFGNSRDPYASLHCLALDHSHKYLAWVSSSIQGPRHVNVMGLKEVLENPNSKLVYQKFTEQETVKFLRFSSHSSESNSAEGSPRFLLSASSNSGPNRCLIVWDLRHNNRFQHLEMTCGVYDAAIFCGDTEDTLAVCTPRGLEMYTSWEQRQFARWNTIEVPRKLKPFHCLIFNHGKNIVVSGQGVNDRVIIYAIADMTVVDKVDRPIDAVRILEGNRLVLLENQMVSLWTPNLQKASSK